jgi:nucleoside phosphorylase
VLAGRAIGHYAPDVALFVGVAGGVKDVNLGDVVVGSKVYGYESGKDTGTAFRPRPDLNRSAHSLEQCARAMSKRNEWRRRLNPDLTRKETPELKVGPIAAGEKVVASQRAETAKFLKNQYGDAIAVEMEGRGFLEAAHVDTVLATVIRGISDRLSGKAAVDRTGSQARAADAASAVAFELLAKLNTTPQAAPPRARGHISANATTGKTPAQHDSNDPAQSAAPTPAFLETKSTLNAASFFNKGEVLARVGVPSVDEVQFIFQELPDGFVRVIPKTAQPRPIPFAELLEKAGHAPLLKTRQYGALSSLNARGALAYDPGGSYRGGPAPLAWGTQLFPNGEIWLASNTAVIRERAGRPDWVPIPFVPALLTEQMFYEKAHAAVEFAVSQLGLSFPCDVQLGILGLKNATLAVKNDDFRGPIQVNDVTVRLPINSDGPNEIDRVLLEFFNALYDATGYAPPPNQFHFPPEAPHM